MFKPAPEPTYEMVCLRLARVEDLPALYALDQRCFRSGIAYTTEEFLSILESHWCVATVAESAIGEVLGLWVLEAYSRKQTCHVLTVEVAPEARRSGLGKLLMQHLEQTAALLGLARVELEVAEDDPAAQEFYFKIGYRKLGKVPRYYLGRIDAIRMEKLLKASR